MAAFERLVTQHLDLWTAAIKRRSATGRGSSNKIEFYGTKKLRALILELAVRGMLVPQDPNDEPASELLKKIAAEKAELVKEGKIKKEKPLPPNVQEHPFGLPDGWMAVRLGVTIDLISGQHLGPTEYFDSPELGTIPYLTGPAEFGEQSPDPTRFTNERRAVAISGDVLLTVKGSGVGKTNLVIHPEIAISRQLMAIRSIATHRPFLEIVLKSLADKFQAQSIGIAIPGISREDVLESELALPPLAEQRRIAAKVDELMVLCDQLEQLTAASLVAHHILVETLLNALISSADHARFVSTWQRIANHFDTLFTTEQSIDQLKQSILQLAVMGKLVPQDPNDEPASKLLNKIENQKAKLVKEGKIKKAKPLQPITEGEKPFVLPMGWEWVRLGQVGICSTGKTPSTREPKFFEGDIPFIGPGQITPQGELLSSDKFVSEEGVYESMEAMPNDILMVCIGGSIGKAAIADKRLAFNQQINSIRPISISSKYLFIAVSTNNFYESVVRESTGSATPIINRSKWEELLIPLSPELEQQRITTKLDRLMALCDQLKACLNSAQTTQLNLTDAMVEIGGKQ